MERLAKALKITVKLMEESYDFYGLSLEEACNQAAEEIGFDARATELMYLLFKRRWNDSLNWSDLYKSEEET